MRSQFKKAHYWFVGLFIFLLTSGVQGSTLITTESKNVPKVQLRTFDANALERFKANDDFQYAREVSITESLWDRFWRWFWQLMEKTFANEATGTAFVYLAILVGIGVVVFVILKLSGMDLMRILTGKSASLDVPYSETMENIHEINFDQNIQNAVNNGNFRLAVRLLYLKSLKKLSDSGLIDWQLNKTNSVYVNEIKHPDKKEEFSALTEQFEFIWYGEFFLEGSKFQQVESLFKNFMSRI